jgi:hypothetical protein
MADHVTPSRSSAQCHRESPPVCRNRTRVRDRLSGRAAAIGRVPEAAADRSNICVPKSEESAQPGAKTIAGRPNRGKTASSRHLSRRTGVASLGAWDRAGRHLPHRGARGHGIDRKTVRRFIVWFSVSNAGSTGNTVNGVVILICAPCSTQARTGAGADVWPQDRRPVRKVDYLRRNGVTRRRYRHPCSRRHDRRGRLMLFAMATPEAESRSSSSRSGPTSRRGTELHRGRALAAVAIWCCTWPSTYLCDSAMNYCWLYSCAGLSGAGTRRSRARGRERGDRTAPRGARTVSVACPRPPLERPDR